MAGVTGLDWLFGENYDPERTISISDYDLDENNQPFKLDNGVFTARHSDQYQVYWTVIKEPEKLCIRNNEMIEAKVYIPVKFDKIRHVVVYSPGYRGDGVCGENMYASLLGSNTRALIFLRHNHLKIQSDDPEVDLVLKSCVHCEQKRKWAQENGQTYLGFPHGDFDCEMACFREIEIPLDAIATKNDEIDFHLIGHSWGGRICLISLYSLSLRLKETFYTSLWSRIKTLTLLAPWWETREEVFKTYSSLIQEDIKKGYFLGMREAKFLTDLSITSGWLTQIGKFWSPPKQAEITVINSPKDEHTKGWEGIFQEVAPIFLRLSSCNTKVRFEPQDCGWSRPTSIDFMPPQSFAQKKVEVHDYFSTDIWNLIESIIWAADVRSNPNWRR